MSLVFSIMIGLSSGIVWGFCSSLWRKASTIIFFSVIVVYLIAMIVLGDSSFSSSWNWAESLAQIISMFIGILAGNNMAEEFK